MKSTLEIIQEIFDSLETDGYTKRFEDISGIYNKIIYKKNNVELVLNVDSRDKTVTYQIFADMEKKYLITEAYSEFGNYYFNKKCDGRINKSVFELTKEYITQEDFIKKKKLIENNKKNHLTEISKIYKKLFIYSLKELEKQEKF